MALQYSTIWYASRSAASGSVSAGTVLCFNSDGSSVVAADTAALATAGGLVCGIALEPSSGDNSVTIQSTGVIANATTGLGAGTSTYVRVSATGTCERIVTIGISDTILGWCNTLGDLFLAAPKTIVSETGAAVVFDDVISTTHINIRSNRVTSQSAIDNTKVGITNLGSDTGLPGPGVTGNYGTIGGGDQNDVEGDYGTISGGVNNAVGLGSPNCTVGGGFQNGVSGDSATVSGGNSNFATFDFSSVGGGSTNAVNGPNGTISGGVSNTAGGNAASIGGGNTNVTGDDFATVSGGTLNTANLASSTIGGGSGNTAGGSYSTVSGGQNNQALDGRCTVSGGRNNTASGGGANGYASICGGFGNSASAVQSFIGGGVNNTASGAGATVSGGNNNTASGDYSTANGKDSTSSRHGQMAHSDGMFASAGDAQYGRMLLRVDSVNGAAAILVNGDDLSFNLEDGKAYAIRATLVANRTDAAGRATFVHDLLAHASAGAAVIDNDNLTLSVLNGEAWTIVYSVTGPDILATFTGSLGHTVRAMVTYEWSELGGGL